LKAYYTKVKMFAKNVGQLLDRCLNIPIFED